MACDYTPGGKAHRLLNRLQDGPATARQLGEVIRGPNQSSDAARNRAWRFIKQLKAERLIVVIGDDQEITATGLTLLRTLDQRLDAEPIRSTVRRFDYQPKGTPA